MKKAVYISSALTLALIFAVIIVLTNLSTVVSYALGKINRGHVHISGFKTTYKKNNIVVDISDIRARGNIEGHVGNCQMVIGIKNGLYLKDAVISDFDLIVSATKGKPRFFPVPENILEIKRGVVTYNKQRFIIDEATVKALRPGKLFSFAIDLRSNALFTAIHSSGEGIYKGKSTEAKGQLNITGLNLNNLSDDMQGRANIKGAFTYAKKNFAFEGPFEMFDYMLKDPVFKKPFAVKNTGGKVSFMHANSTIDIKISNACYQNAPIVLDLKFVKNSLAKLEFSLDFFSVREVKKYIARDSLTKTKFDIWKYIDDGKIKINKFAYDKKRPLYMELELKNTGISYKDMFFTDVEALLLFKENELSISAARGLFKTSRLYDVNGAISFSKEKYINMKGNYSFNLKDVQALIDTGGINFKDGETEGTIEFRGNKDSGFKIEGTGKFNNADIIWKKLSLSAKGAYKFNNDEIIFDTLTVNRGDTDMVIRGKWHKNFLDLKIKGDLDAVYMRPFMSAGL
jgi:hypothetical protein